jgi:chromosome segregation ATPase
MASYLGRNVNLALLIIIIGVVVALVGTTVFFQRSLQNRTGAYESTTDQLTQCNVALSNYMGQYSAAQQKVNQTSQDIKKYDQLYEQKVAELKETQDTLEVTEKQLAFEKTQKQKLQTLYEAEARKTAELSTNITRLESDIRSLRRELRTCQGE